MRRRAFLGGLCSSLTVSAFSAQAQQSRLPRRLGVVMVYTEGDVEGQARLSALMTKLGQLGWLNGRDLQVGVRWAAGQANLMRDYAAEFVNSPVDVLVVNSTPLLTVAKQLTDTIPIVFTQVADPVSSGFLTSYSRPGANITGFTDFDVSIAGKWVAILKEAVPGVERVTVLLDPDQKNHGGFLQAAEAAAPAVRLQVSKAEVRSRADIEREITSLSGKSGGGLLVLPGPVSNTQRDVIVHLANRLRLPAVYPLKYYVREGGLLYYGCDQVDQWSGAAAYVDRILRGEKPGDLPVQAPTKFELIVNAGTAKAMGLTIPPTLIAAADEVID